MLDLKLIREDPDRVRSALARRGSDAADGLDRVIALDARRRGLLPELEGLRAEQNEANSRIRSAADADVREREIEAMRGVAAKAKTLEQELSEVGEPTQLDFTPRDHLELAGERIDMDRAANLSGTRFAYLKGDLVMLELALVRWVLGKLRDAGFEPVIPPVLVRERALYRPGFLPD